MDSNIVKFRDTPVNGEHVALPAKPTDPDDLDRASPILKAAVTYTSAHAAFGGGFRADHTDNLVMGGGVFGSKHINRRDRALNRLTRLMEGDVRSVELRSLASVAIVMMDQDGGDDGLSIEGFERRFLKSLFQLIERGAF